MMKSNRNALVPRRSTEPTRAESWRRLQCFIFETWYMSPRRESKIDRIAGRLADDDLDQRAKADAIEWRF